MKKRFFFLGFAALTLITSAVFAQEKDDKRKRPSPPAKAEGTVDGAKIVIDYSQPSAKGRKMLPNRDSREFILPAVFASRIFLCHSANALPRCDVPCDTPLDHRPNFIAQDLYKVITNTASSPQSFL